MIIDISPKYDSGFVPCILFGLITPQQSETVLIEYLDELAFLATTAGSKSEKYFFQKVEHPHVATYFGKGKVEEINTYIHAKNIRLAICDDDLSPSQLRNLEEIWKIQVLDRSSLILDIFAMRARTSQARTQVELAQLQYLLPRLRGMWKHLERQQGGIGSRGPGEKEIETDRRVANIKIAQLKQKLKDIDKQSLTQRKTRGDLIRVALVGYTNVGKSTIMQMLTKEEIFVENKLFATLDTLVRKVTFERTPFLLSDTVGFIRKLPHHLVESFKSTLDEVREADILVHVVDISHPTYEHQMQIVVETLQELKAGDKKVLTVFNKMDVYKEKFFDEFIPQSEKDFIENEMKMKYSQALDGNVVFISATQKDNIEEFRQNLLDMVKQQYALKFPFLVEFY